MVSLGSLRMVSRGYALFLEVLAGVLLIGLAATPPKALAGHGRGFAQATRLAERHTLPEPFSPWAMADDEIERLVVRGELPLEAWTFRPVDRGEIAAWLSESESWKPGPSPSRTRLEELLRWESSWLAGASQHEQKQPARVDKCGLRSHPIQARCGDRPGNLIRYRAADRFLFIGPYVRFMPILRDGDRYDWTDSSRVGVRVVFCAGSSVVISAGIFAAEIDDARSFADPLVAGTDFILYEEEATLSARLGAFRLRLGRDQHHWGPGVSGTLLLSDAGAAFNFAEYQLRMGDHLRLLALTGITSLHQERYVSAHRLTWTPTPDLSISFSEGARYQANAPHLLYAVGIVPYTLVERLDLQDSLSDPDRDRQRNNLLWSLDAAWRPQTGWLVYAELLADDIATETSEMPTRGGVQAGVTTAPRWRDWDWTLGAEYTRVSNYTYSVYYQDLCLCDWEHQDKPIGYRLGPDVESVLLRCNLDPAPAWGGRAWLRQVRKGEGCIGRPWKPADESECDPASDPDCGPVSAWKLSGTVERTLAVGLELHYRPSPVMRVGIWVEALRIEHRMHAQGTDPYLGSRLGLSLSLGVN